MNRLFPPFLVMMFLGLVTSGCNHRQSTEPDTLTEVDLLTTAPVVKSGMALHIHLVQVRSPWFEGVWATAGAENRGESDILFWDSCGGGLNPRVVLRDEAGTEYGNACYPHPLCPEAQGLAPLAPGGTSEGWMRVQAGVCEGNTRVPLPSGRYTVVAEFRFQDDPKGSVKLLTQSVLLDWDAETRTGSVPD